MKIINFKPDNFWHSVYPDGATEEEILAELSDFEVLIENISKVYCHVTGGMVSKPMTDPSVVISLADDFYAEDNKCEICEAAND